MRRPRVQFASNRGQVWWRLHQDTHGTIGGAHYRGFAVRCLRSLHPIQNSISFSGDSLRSIRASLCSTRSFTCVDSRFESSVPRSRRRDPQSLCTGAHSTRSIRQSLRSGSHSTDSIPHVDRDGPDRARCRPHHEDSSPYEIGFTPRAVGSGRRSCVKNPRRVASRRARDRYIQSPGRLGPLTEGRNPHQGL